MPRAPLVVLASLAIRVPERPADPSPAEPPAAHDPWIEDVRLSSDVIVLAGDNVPFDAVLRNGTGAALSEVAVQAWLEQGSTLRAAGGAITTCTRPLGTLPVGTCRHHFSIGAGIHAAGHGDLRPGPATARLDLQVGGVVVDSVELPVTLTLGP